MRYTGYAILGIALLVAIYLVALYGVHRSPVVESAVTSISTTTIATSTETYSIDLSYPKFGIAGADASVQSVIDKAVSEFVAFPPNPTPVAAKNELVGEYQLVNPGPDIVSAREELYQYTGGAHGGTVIYGFNFHKDGTEVTEEEALSLIGKDLQAVSAEASRQLNAQFGMVQFPEGAAPTAENYRTFLIGTSTVSFIFQQYQVEAYAAGSPTIVFPRVR